MPPSGKRQACWGRAGAGWLESAAGRWARAWRHVASCQGSLHQPPPPPPPTRLLLLLATCNGHKGWGWQGYGRVVSLMGEEELKAGQNLLGFGDKASVLKFYCRIFKLLKNSCIKWHTNTHTHQHSHTRSPRSRKIKKRSGKKQKRSRWRAEEGRKSARK